MSEPLLAQLASIPILGISTQWLAWRLELPAILLLLLFGLLAGPVTGLLQPEALLGPLLPPVVSLAVAVILFEGGLSLTLAELGHLGPVVRRLLTVGSLFTWAGSTGAAYYLLGFSLPLAALLGAILVVTGPTVIGPLLRHVRPQDRLALILRWEGIVIDPLGAILAVLVFEAVLAGGLSQATAKLATALLTTLAVGGLFGLLGAGLTVVLFKRYWIPDFLHSPMVLVLVIGCFTGANELRQESGLLAMTMMGIILANQGQVAIKHVSEFKENLSVLLVSSLFILLAARLQLSDLSQLDLASLGFLGVLILLLRPGAV
ncbi:MAG TPA: cation:proton antiporter, partial [Candidatus Competibacteraceae bacterium]|nr:cation:proton antiporter [Candidatus Competibacteraceae bacterium]